MVIGTEMTVNLFMIVIYLIILYVFNRAKSKFRGGSIERVINLILISVFFLLCADYTVLLKFVLSDDLRYVIEVLFRLIALSVLAVGGLRLLSI
ncbi:MAG: hypothetical protein HY788_22640 [Deltaproteobacteria bacterium]|nr:hypothetical protein [Deltaproteobacteria bacterium]